MVSIEELAALFRGDEDSFGYAHSELIVEICSRTAKSFKPSVEWVWGIVYPDVPKEKVPLEIQDMIVSGVKLWYRRGCPRKKAV